MKNNRNKGYVKKDIKYGYCDICMADRPDNHRAHMIDYVLEKIVASSPEMTEDEILDVRG